MNFKLMICQQCPYFSTEIFSPLSIEKKPNASILLVFQSPGRDEWENKTPISSENRQSTAARIRNALTRVGKSREEFDITNAVQCFSGISNTGRDKKPSKIARKYCMELLRLDISSKPYDKVIVFGQVAQKSVETIMALMNTQITTEYLKHPSGGLSNHDLDSALR